MGLQGGAQAHRVPRNQRSSFAMISIVLLSGGAKTAENPIMESACNYEASVSYVLPRASQHARDSNGVRERTRAPALIYFTWRKREGERMLPSFFYPRISSTTIATFTTPPLLRYAFIYTVVEYATPSS